MKNIAFIMIMAMLGTFNSKAQIQKVDQEVYGMDCAPCAYGLERGLKKMDGLKDVRVSLNDGKAYLRMTLDNELTLRAIQEEVKKNGFSAKKAEVTISGILKKENGQWVIETDKEQFAVSRNTSSKLIQNLSVGRVTVRGTIQDEEDGTLSDRWSMLLTKTM